MPDLQIVPLNAETLADEIDPPLTRDLTKPHVSELIEMSLKSIGRGYSDSPPPEGIMAMGRIWEYAAREKANLLATETQGQFISSPVVEKDGVIASLDGYIVWAGDSAVLEIKLKFSAPKDPRENFRWMSQVKSYCHIMNAKRVIFIVGHLLHSPPRMVAVKYGLRFTEAELQENWQMIMNQAKEWHKQRETETQEVEA